MDRWKQKDSFVIRIFFSFSLLLQIGTPVKLARHEGGEGKSRARNRHTYLPQRHSVPPRIHATPYRPSRKNS